MIDYYPPKFPDDEIVWEKNDVPSPSEVQDEFEDLLRDMGSEYAKTISDRRKREEENDALANSNSEYSDSDE